MRRYARTFEAPYGYRARVGLIVVGPNLNPTHEIARMLPDYVEVRETRIHMEPVVTVEECMKLSEPLGQAARVLAEGLCSPILGNRSAIAFACTAGSLVGGPGWDRREIEMMETATADFPCYKASIGGQGKGIPCTTTATAAEEAMKFMGFKKIVITGPYIDEINAKFKAFYENSGFEVLKVTGLGIRDLYEMGATKPSDAYRAALEAVVPEADGIFIACTNFRCSDVIEQIEHDTGKPVVTANQATAWHLMKLLGINDVVEGYGQLLRKVPRV
ncbi:maleate cis-trans isomerase family protein [Thermodesulforhabdus norvegica]|uniref:Maleate isomerase n=1 Tax=Thermodesulforhabdus norvegica TaxID=39841 RepID=A0A1I4R336_9BACT|nr:aspartate/glutamate racemase family protein [Thermodesulforhabdus norvegica]SFM46677.1 maleate isomerase [Thermodesulforhabdus norvegica]